MPPPVEDRGTVQIEYVNHPATEKGAPAAQRPGSAARPSAAAAPAGPAAAAEASRPAPPSAAAGRRCPVAGLHAAPPAPRRPEPAVHLGDADQDPEALSVTGDDVVSSGPDARYRNMPPNYPREAARRHEHGTVEVLIHITPRGEPGEIEIVASSGSSALDEATRDAVMKWHFKPAIHDGAPVASIYPLRIRFRDDRG